jgi:hypothetical protein
MNRISSVIKMQLKDKWSWVFIPWLILLFSFAINFTIALLMKENEDMYTGGLASMYIYMLVAGIVTLSQTFPFALGLSVRRTDYFWGTAIMIALISAVNTILLYLFSLLEQLTGSWGIQLRFFNLPYLNEGPAIGQLGMHFIVMVHCFFLGFAISSVHRRFGVKGMYILTAIVLLLISVGTFLFTNYRWWDDIFRFVSQYSASELALWMVPALAFYMLMSYLMLRKATV